MGPGSESRRDSAREPRAPPRPLVARHSAAHVARHGTSAGRPGRALSKHTRRTGNGCPATMEAKLQSLKVPELKELLQNAALAVTGNKPDLIKRLIENPSAAASILTYVLCTHEVNRPKPRQRPTHLRPRHLHRSRKRRLHLLLRKPLTPRRRRAMTNVSNSTWRSLRSARHVPSVLGCLPRISRSRSRMCKRLVCLPKSPARKSPNALPSVSPRRRTARVHPSSRKRPNLPLSRRRRPCRYVSLAHHRKRNLRSERHAPSGSVRRSLRLRKPSRHAGSVGVTPVYFPSCGRITPVPFFLRPC